MLRSIKFTTKPFNKLEKSTQENLCSLSKTAIVPKNLLSFAVAYRKHCCEKLVVEPVAAMKRPDSDIVLSQFATAYNNPDVLMALAATWPVGQTASTERLVENVKRIYATMSDPSLKFDKVYPTRSTPLHQVLNRRRVLQLKVALMSEDKKYISGLSSEIQEVAKLNLETQDAASKAPKDGETLFIEEYAPFGVGEICGDFQDSETITGMQGSNHHKN